MLAKRGERGERDVPGPDAGGDDCAAGGGEMNAQVDLWLTTDATPVHDARALTEGGSLARIVLDGQVYSLRITRAGKLILTK